RQQEQRARLSLRVAARQEALPYAGRIEPRFILLPHLGRELSALVEVGIHLGLVSEIVPQHRVHVAELQGGILVGNGFRRRPWPKGGHEGIERDPRAADPYDAVRVGDQRDRFRGDSYGHRRTSSGISSYGNGIGYCNTAGSASRRRLRVY